MRNNRIKATFICAQNITATCQLCDLWELLSSSDLQFLTIRRHGEESDAAVKRPYTQPEMCKYVFYEPRTSFLSEKTSNRQIDTEVLILYRWPFLGILPVFKKKKKTPEEKKWTISNTSAHIIRETKGFPVSTQLICLHFSLGNLKPISHRATSWALSSGTAAPGRKAVSKRNSFPWWPSRCGSMVNILLPARWGGWHLPLQDGRGHSELAWREKQRQELSTRLCQVQPVIWVGEMLV